MKKKIKQILLLLVAVLAITKQETNVVWGAEEIIEKTDEEATRGDEIIIQYRIYNGIIQYRHWNVTKNRWVEPDWINL